ncbi:HAD family phosphatase [Halobacteria archaeon AArc-m2/3/4]|uniref:HAD family phosphatase n=1 Tax=Natronoglomus mannanivorans TaxID=2979990 RepID=A0ABT2QAC5_9EURY|nr:HAD family phosphatase [Halobacteria archaeon AArc-m2/3/4]
MTDTAVLFDMDGVIVDSEDYWVDLEREELLPEVVPHADVSVAEITGMNYREIYDYLEAEYGTAVSREEFLDLFETAARDLYTERVALLEGFHDLLAELEDRDVPVAIVSSSPHDWIGIVCERFDLEGAFDAIVSAEGIDGPGKPEPHIYEHAAGEIGAPVTDCVAIEDSQHGLESAAAAGSTVVAYRIDAHTDLDFTPADVVVDDPDELRRTVLELIG